MLYQLSYRPKAAALLGFAVGAVAAAEAAILVELQPIRRLLLVLLRIVVAALALSACQNYHYTRFFLGHRFPSGLIRT